MFCHCRDSKPLTGACVFDAGAITAYVYAYAYVYVYAHVFCLYGISLCRSFTDLCSLLKERVKHFGGANGRNVI